MLKNNVVDISYVRTSTGGTSQLSSLGNQTIQLRENPSHGDIVTHTGSGGCSFPPDLKSKVLELYDGKIDIRINVVSFDRLTRNFTDLDFINKYIRYINVLDEEKIYDVKTDMEIITSRVNQCVQELGMIKNRCARNNGNKKSPRNNNGESKIINLRKRCRCTTSNLSAYGITDQLLEQLEKFICVTQNLDNLDKWEEMYSLMDDLGLDSDEAREDYSRYTNRYSSVSTTNTNKQKNPKKRFKSEVSEIDHIPISQIRQKEVMDFVVTVIDQNEIEKNELFIKQFVNSHVRYGKMCENDDNDNTQKSTGVENLIKRMEGLNFDSSDIKKLQNIINSKKKH